MKLALALDFDGTVTTRDLGVQVVNEFAGPGWKDGLNRWRAGEIDQSQLMEWEFERLPSDRADEMRAFALRQAEVRPGFRELIDFCSRSDITVEVVSNGMQFYVQAVLEREGFEDLPHVAPIPTFAGMDRGSRPVVEFAPGVETCLRTGLCKCARTRGLRNDGRKVVFVGDGISDNCVVEEEADYVIARSSLKEHCEANDIQHVGFDDFHDVIRELERLLDT